MKKKVARLEEMKHALAKATPGKWRWSVYELGLQLESDGVEYPEDSPVLVAKGCGNHTEGEAVEGCHAKGTEKDPMRGCPLHPSKADRDYIVISKNAMPRILSVLEATREFALVVSLNTHLLWKNKRAMNSCAFERVCAIRSAVSKFFAFTREDL